jgi:flagellar biosynthesis/type III secretory pathway protein FliH
MSDASRNTCFRAVSAPSDARIVIQVVGGDPEEPEQPCEEYLRGYREAESARQSEVDVLRDQLELWSDRVPQELSDYLNRLEQEIREEVSALALDLAETIVRSPCHRRQVILSAIQEGISNVLPQEKLEVLIHPEDFEVVAQPPDPPWSSRVQVTADPAVHAGDVELRSASGMLDGTVENRMAQLRETVADILTSENAGEETREPEPQAEEPGAGP